MCRLNHILYNIWIIWLNFLIQIKDQSINYKRGLTESTAFYKISLYSMERAI